MPLVSPRVQALSPYAPGLSADAIREKYGVANVVKLASNENPLGASPLALAEISRHASGVFLYPRGGNPDLIQAIASAYNAPLERVVAANGSDEIIDLLIRVLAEPDRHNVLCFDPCFAIYPIQAKIAGVETRRALLKSDFSFNTEALLNLADKNTRLVFLTSPDNPSGYAAPAEALAEFARALALKAPDALLLIDEAYADFAPDEQAISLLRAGAYPENVGFLRTFSKSYGLAGLRCGFAILPENVADAIRRARLPFSLNVLAERAAIAALRDEAFRDATLKTVAAGRSYLKEALATLDCAVWPSSANFLMFEPPAAIDPDKLFANLLKRGVIIRPLKSYGMPRRFRVSVGTPRENEIFIAALAASLRE